MSESDKGSANNKWWEFYLVRYFVGTVVGSIIILQLISLNSPTLQKIILSNTDKVSLPEIQTIIILAALGLAFCYISSSPILVFHATRGVFFSNFSDTQKGWTRVSFTTAVTAIAINALAYCDLAIALSVVIFAVILLSQLALLYFSFLHKGEITYTYYSSLTKARSNQTEQIRQYIESYKHLREHGNAFFILLFEILLGIILYAAPSIESVLIVILFWILPAVFVWLIGTLLENRLTTVL